MENRFTPEGTGEGNFSNQTPTEPFLDQITSPKKHAHYWVIEEVHGPTSDGQCRGCGACRTFKNSPSDEVLIRSEWGKIR